MIRWHTNTQVYIIGKVVVFWQVCCKIWQKKFRWPLSWRGRGGVKALVAGPLRKELFLRLPYDLLDIHYLQIYPIKMICYTSKGKKKKKLIIHISVSSLPLSLFFSSLSLSLFSSSLYLFLSRSLNFWNTSNKCPKGWRV